MPVFVQYCAVFVRSLYAFKKTLSGDKTFLNGYLRTEFSGRCREVTAGAHVPGDRYGEIFN